MSQAKPRLRIIRNITLSMAMTGTMVALTQTALADNGGNGEGNLDLYNSSSVTSTAPISALQWGGTYYIELTNPGNKSKLWNEVNAPAHLTFNFFNPPRPFKADPGKWDTSNPTFSVTGTEVDGSSNKAPFVYKFTLPSKVNNGSYTIEAGPVAFNHSTGHGENNNKGEDEMYFSNDPNIGGGSISIGPTTPAGQMPEVPYAGILPAVILAGGAFVYLRRRRKAKA
ncbi:hypothetical protein [Alicyclobacillus sp. SO9]|uniref:hypothetical protein n=1 Tax=Alicyclobacillus sp. SO9 TaxID=2665646 RepID=UPI0018E72A43|nr:hypothetical protein [Alicyclobacillus sp. SO9]QQE78870.1 hypothetical protein GI364_24045 [Alicyclobacillus sp. SO9]